jgi:hypothetical protein
LGLQKKNTLLPIAYHILPKSIDFIIPGFRRFYTLGDKTFALSDRGCAQWFQEFVDRLVAACGNTYLPVCRMSDGEFLFVLGHQPPDVRLPRTHRIRRQLGQLIQHWRSKGQFEARTPGHYHSGNYNAAEWREAQEQYAQQIRTIGEKGILALHLSYGRVPFQERYFPALSHWLHKNQIFLNDQNYVPFYFVYGLLTGPQRRRLLHGRRVLVVNGAQGDKRKQVEDGLRRENVAEVHWCTISLERSLFDALDVTSFIGKVDIVLVGAGIGKPNILVQLEPLQVPCVDAGYIFEVWANPENGGKRRFCLPDDAA